jgi:hypothetical protein
MSQQELESYLSESLQKLEAAAKRIEKSQNFNFETKKIRTLIELVKEQLRNENSLSAARPLR